MRQRVRVVLADDHDVFVEGLSMVLAAEEDLEVVAVANDAAAALQAVLAHQPDVLVADADLPGPDLAELVRLVARARAGSAGFGADSPPLPLRPRRPGTMS